VDHANATDTHVPLLAPCFLTRILHATLSGLHEPLKSDISLPKLRLMQPAVHPIRHQMGLVPLSVQLSLVP
jgi:hypothetical protein